MMFDTSSRIIGKSKDMAYHKRVIKNQTIRRKTMNENKQYSDFTKKNIFDIYEVLYNFIERFSDTENEEESFCQMRANISKKKIATPVLVYEKIENFVSAYFEPMIYEPNIIFSESRSVGEIIDGVQHLRDENEAFMCMGAYLDKLIQIQQALEDWAMKELHPLLMP